MSSGRRQMLLECPRCGRRLIAFNGEPDIECNCHLYCDEGSKPSDCSVTWPYEWSGSLGWPLGLDTQPDSQSAQRYRAMGYCATHDRYYYKDKVVIELNWSEYFANRAPTRFRYTHGKF